MKAHTWIYQATPFCNALQCSWASDGPPRNTRLAVLSDHQARKEAHIIECMVRPVCDVCVCDLFYPAYLVTRLAPSLRRR